MERMIATCGLICTECEAYIVAQSGDVAAQEALLKKWVEEYHAEGMTINTMLCDGCKANTGRACGHCAECEIRACGEAKGVANCGVCAEYHSCEKIAGFMKEVPKVKEVLDAQ